MKSVSTSTLSSALNNTVVASFGIGLMLLTSAQLTGEHSMSFPAAWLLSRPGSTGSEVLESGQHCDVKVVSAQPVQVISML